MKKNPILLIVSSDVHQTFATMTVVGVAHKDNDAQKLYAQALKKFKVTTKQDGTDNNDYCIGVYRVDCGILSEDTIREGEKLYTSEGQ